MAYSTTPTTNATISIKSSGMSSDTMNMSQTFELVALDNITSLKNTTGVRRIEGANSGVTIYDSSAYGDPDHMVWIWIHNPNTTTNGSVYVLIELVNHETTPENCTLGKLFEGKSCLIPILGGNDGSTNNALSDVKVTTATAADWVEYCVFAERMDNDSAAHELGK